MKTLTHTRASALPGTLFAFAMLIGILSSQPLDRAAAQVSPPQNGGLCSTAPNVLTWTTASEVNTVGFNLYRSESKDGPFTQINTQVIPTTGDAVTGSKYRYEDKEVLAGRTYYYQLEDVEAGGTTTRHGPIIITAQGSLWICELLGPLGSAGILLLYAVGALIAIAVGVYLGRRWRLGS